MTPKDYQLELDKVENLLDKAESTLLGNSRIGNITLSVNAGGIGVIISAICCAAAMSAILVGGVLGTVWVSHEFQRRDAEVAQMRDHQSKQDAYISVIYQYAPQLPKPEEKKK